MAFKSHRASHPNQLVYWKCLDAPAQGFRQRLEIEGCQASVFLHARQDSEDDGKAHLPPYRLTAVQSKASYASQKKL